MEGLKNSDRVTNKLNEELEVVQTRTTYSKQLMTSTKLNTKRSQILSCIGTSFGDNQSGELQHQVVEVENEQN